MVITDHAGKAGFCRDWMGDVISDAVAVLRPRNTAEVSMAVLACRDLGLSIIPQGGNTGLVLGGIPDHPSNQVILSLERMNRIRSIDIDDFSAVVDAGCVLATVKDAVAEQGMIFPLALGAQGSCQIGGNVSTNAGGLNVLRYGMTRDLVLGLEVVLPNGKVLEGLSSLRKDNRGIDLKQLFIGAEGMLGIVTGVSIKLMPAPDQIETALLGVGSLEAAVALYRRARRDCCDLMSAFEFMPPMALILAKEAMPDLDMPIAMDYPAYVLMEISASGLVDVGDLMQRFLTNVMEEGHVIDGVIASSSTQASNLWKIREGMVEGQALRGRHMRTDISVPLSRLSDFVAVAEEAVRAKLPECVAISYGHVGDGNVHLNVLPPMDASEADRTKQIDYAKKIVNEVVDMFQGSISAEHGIGRLKRDDFELRLQNTQRLLLHTLKNAIDPLQMFNPNSQISIAERDDASSV